MPLALLLLAICLAANVLLGPLGVGVIQWHVSAIGINQTFGADAVSLVLVAPASHAANPQPISSICAVLAESEIINHVSAGVAVEDIVGGIYDSLASRAALLLKRVNVSNELTFVGGVARQRGMARALERRLQVQVNVPKDCEYVCALGAALLGFARLQKIVIPSLKLATLNGFDDGR